MPDVWAARRFKNCSSPRKEDIHYQLDAIKESNRMRFSLWRANGHRSFRQADSPKWHSGSVLRTDLLMSDRFIEIAGDAAEAP